MKTKRVFVLVLILIGAILSASILVGFQQYKGTLYTQETAEIERATGHVEHALANRLEALRETVEVGATNDDLARHGSDAQRQALEDFVDRSAFGGASVIAVNGTMTSIATGDVRATNKSLVGSDFSDRVYFQRAMAGETYVTEPFAAESGHYVITVSTPIHRDGTRVGTLNAAFHLSEQDFFSDFTAPLEDEQWLTVRADDGTLIYTSPGPSGSNPIVRDATLAESGWTVVVGESRAELQSTIRRVTYLQVASLLLVLGTLAGFGWWVYQRNLKQLTQLLDGFEAMENHEYETRVDLAGADEWRHIQEGFNNLARTLETHMTERERYEQTLQQQRDRLDLLNQVMRHDIRNDMQVVTGRAEMLTTHVDDSGREHLTSLRQSADKVIQLTKTARDLTNTMLREEEPLRQVRVDRHLEEQLDAVQSRHAHATMELDGDVPAVTVWADEMIDAVFRNLLQNAVVHNDTDAPEIRASVDRDGDAVVVRIADNGPGVPDGQKESIFGKGEKGLDSPGTGLGLYLVKTLVDNYGGDVWVEDNQPEGAVFAVRLRVADAE